MGGDLLVWGFGGVRGERLSAFFASLNQKAATCNKLISHFNNTYKICIIQYLKNRCSS